MPTNEERTTENQATNKVVIDLDSQSSSNSAEDDEIFEVDGIRAEWYNSEDDNVYYLVKWKGYVEEENTWEPADNIHSEDTLTEWKVTRTRQVDGDEPAFDVEAWIEKSDAYRERKERAERLEALREKRQEEFGFSDESDADDGLELPLGSRPQKRRTGSQSLEAHSTSTEQVPTSRLKAKETTRPEKPKNLNLPGVAPLPVSVPARQMPRKDVAKVFHAHAVIRVDDTSPISPALLDEASTDIEPVHEVPRKDSTAQSAYAGTAAPSSSKAPIFTKEPISSKAPNTSTGPSSSRGPRLEVPRRPSMQQKTDDSVAFFKPKNKRSAGRQVALRGGLRRGPGRPPYPVPEPGRNVMAKSWDTAPKQRLVKTANSINPENKTGTLYKQSSRLNRHARYLNNERAPDPDKIRVFDPKSMEVVETNNSLKYGGYRYGKMHKTPSELVEEGRARSARDGPSNEQGSNAITSALATPSLVGRDTDLMFDSSKQSSSKTPVGCQNFSTEGSRQQNYGFPKTASSTTPAQAKDLAADPMDIDESSVPMESAAEERTAVESRGVSDTTRETSAAPTEADFLFVSDEPATMVLESRPKALAVQTSNLRGDTMGARPIENDVEMEDAPLRKTSLPENQRTAEREAEHRNPLGILRRKDEPSVSSSPLFSRRSSYPPVLGSRAGQDDLEDSNRPTKAPRTEVPVRQAAFPTPVKSKTSRRPPAMHITEVVGDSDMIAAHPGSKAARLKEYMSDIFGHIILGKNNSSKSITIFRGLPKPVNKLLLSIKTNNKDVHVWLSEQVTASEWLHRYHKEGQGYFGAGHIVIHRADHHRDMERVSKELWSEGRGGVFHAKDFTMLVYPAGDPDWDFLDRQYRFRPEASPRLRFVMRTPTQSLIDLAGTNEGSERPPAAADGVLDQGQRLDRKGFPTARDAHSTPSVAKKSSGQNSNTLGGLRVDTRLPLHHSTIKSSVSQQRSPITSNSDTTARPHTSLQSPLSASTSNASFQQDLDSGLLTIFTTISKPYGVDFHDRVRAMTPEIATWLLETIFCSRSSELLKLPHGPDTSVSPKIFVYMSGRDREKQVLIRALEVAKGLSAEVYYKEHEWQMFGSSIKSGIVVIHESIPIDKIPHLSKVLMFHNFNIFSAVMPTPQATGGSLQRIFPQGSAALLILDSAVLYDTANVTRILRWLRRKHHKARGWTFMVRPRFRVWLTKLYEERSKESPQAALPFKGLFEQLNAMAPLEEMDDDEDWEVPGVGACYKEPLGDLEGHDWDAGLDSSQDRTQISSNDHAMVSYFGRWSLASVRDYRRFNVILPTKSPQPITPGGPMPHHQWREQLMHVMFLTAEAYIHGELIKQHEDEYKSKQQPKGPRTTPKTPI